jgi:hypothetical protein
MTDVASLQTMRVSACLKRLSTANPAEMLTTPTESLKLSSSATVHELVTSFFSRARDLDVAPAQNVYLLFGREIIEPQQHEGLTIEELGVPDGYHVHLLAPYLIYTSSIEHVVLKLPRPKPSGKQFLVFPPEMGYDHMEDVAAWLCSPRVAAYAKYTFSTPGRGRGDDSADVKGKIANRIEKMARVWPILGGEVMAERSVHNFTVHFDDGQAAVRQKLEALRAAFMDESQRSLFPHDMSKEDAEWLRIPTPCSAMVNVERAMTVAIRICSHRIIMVGSPLCITTEPSGEQSLSRWVEGVRDVHGAVSFMFRPGLLASPQIADPYKIVEDAFTLAGLVAKSCAGHVSSSMPGLKSNMLIPQVLILLWEYELKTPFTREDCCIVKELFGAKQSMGYICWVRKWKSANAIPCGKYPTIAYLRMGPWTESIADRPISEQLANFKLKSPQQVADELARINDALPPGAKKRKQVHQDRVGPCLGETEAESQSAAQMLKPLKEALSQIPSIHLGAKEHELLQSVLTEVTDMSSLDYDNFDAVPEEMNPDDMTEDELRALSKELIRRLKPRG